MRINIIKDELTNDPAAIGYSSMDDTEATIAINAKTQSDRSDPVTPPALYELIDANAVISLNTQDRNKYDISVAPVFNIPEGVPANGQLDKIISEVFGATSVTYTGYVTGTTIIKSRAELLNLRSVNVAEVTEARM